MSSDRRGPTAPGRAAIKRRCKADSALSKDVEDHRPARGPVGRGGTRKLSGEVLASGDREVVDLHDAIAHAPTELLCSRIKDGCHGRATHREAELSAREEKRHDNLHVTIARNAGMETGLEMCDLHAQSLDAALRSVQLVLQGDVLQKTCVWRVYGGGRQAHHFDGRLAPMPLDTVQRIPPLPRGRVLPIALVWVGPVWPAAAPNPGAHWIRHVSERKAESTPRRLRTVRQITAVIARAERGRVARIAAEASRA